MDETLNLQALCDYLADLDPAFSDPNRVVVTPFVGGASNLTALVESDGKALVVRRAPPGRKAATAHDMVREAKLLQAIRPHFPYVAKVHAVCDDPEVLGTRFFVMEHLQGVDVGRDFPFEVSPAQARLFCERLIDLQAQMHQVDLDASGLNQLGKPEGYVQRQIEGWSKRYRAAHTKDVPTCEAIIGWLQQQMPAESGVGLIHNDFKFDNLILDKNDVSRIAGVVDWEMATIGDPLMDLGASLAYWVEATDDRAMRAIRTQPTTLPGMMTRDEVVAYYAVKTNRQIPDYTYYYVYGLFRLAGIAQQIYLRYTLGQTKNPRFAKLGHAVCALAAQAERVIEGASHGL